MRVDRREREAKTARDVLAFGHSEPIAPGFRLRTGLQRRRATAALFGRFDHVADAAHGVDQLLLIAVVDFAAQVADVDVDDVGQAVVIHIPDVLHDHGAAERAALVAHHVFEDAEFLGRELDALVAAHNFAARAVEHEVAHLQAFGRGLAAAQQSADARQQLDEGERLGEVIVGAVFRGL